MFHQCHARLCLGVQAGEAGRLMKRAGVNGIPHAFVVDRSGSIVYRCGAQ